jgi:hypothetical protein
MSSGEFYCRETTSVAERENRFTIWFPAAGAPPRVTIEDDSARNHRNTLLWTICPLQQDSVAKHASQSSRLSLLRRSPAALAHSENAPAPSSDERRDHEFTVKLLKTTFRRRLSRFLAVPPGIIGIKH